MSLAAVVDTRSEFAGLSTTYLLIAIGVVALVWLALAAIVVRWRARPGEHRAPVGRTSNAPLEVGYVVVLTCVAALLVTLTFRTESKVDAVSSHPALRVHVIAAKWRWRFEYPGGVVQDGANDRPSTLVVPTRETVGFALDALDVIHAFWIPDLRFKRDAIPGRTNRFDLDFPRAGYFPGAGVCSEFCGLLHSQMRFNVRALPPAAFRAWLRRRQGRT
jgi:cytochrome c oxidase subunit 2